MTNSNERYKIYDRCIILYLSNIQKRELEMTKEKKDNEKRKEFFWYPVAVEIAVIALMAVATWAAGFFSLPKTMENIAKRLDALEKNVENLDVENRFAGVNQDIAALSSKVDVIGQLVLDNTALVLQPTYKAIDSMKVEYVSVKNEFCLSAPSWNTTDIIATDLASGKEYSAGELVGETLLLPYISEGNEVYFYGQFDEKNQWDGNCLINVYSNDQLALIMEAEYNHGLLTEYKQVLPAQTLGKTNVWIIAERTNMGDSNSGDSWNYIREKGYEKAFDLDTVTNKDIITVDEFRNIIDTRIEGFYHGNTSDGLYNDNTGDAYLVKYNEDGTVRTLYNGRFKDGIFEDTTGYAWYITKNENTDYMYYQGQFDDGKPVHDSKSVFENGLTQERINEILQEKGFTGDLKWDFDSSM